MSSKPKILCVDDENSVLDALERLLRRDFNVTRASSAEEGRKKIDEAPHFSIVLSDYRMPGDNGIDFLRYVRNKLPTAARAILSGQMDATDIVEAINNAEIHRFILKPWDNEYLRLQMLEAIQTHRRLETQEDLKIVAITDPVTGLTNHRYFQEFLREKFTWAQENNRPLSLVMIDVDHFKSFNDRYGHPEGDRLLLSVASKIKEFCPNSGAASRYGGEEFVLVLPDLSVDKASELANQIRKSIERNKFNGPFGRPSYVTISLGVAGFPEHCSSATELVEHADQALYKAKELGRNQTKIYLTSPA